MERTSKGMLSIVIAGQLRNGPTACCAQCLDLQDDEDFLRAFLVGSPLRDAKASGHTFKRGSVGLGLVKTSASTAEK